MDKQIKYISYHQALKDQKAGQSVIVDVRQPAEFLDGHLPYSVNLPSTSFQAQDYQAWQTQKIYLICQSGNRAAAIAQKLSQNGHQNVYVLDRHIEDFNLSTAKGRWSVDRQFRMLLGILIALYLIGYHFSSALFTAIPVILCSGLIITAIIDKCYLRMGIAMLPWNADQTE